MAETLRMLCPSRGRPGRAALLLSEWETFASPGTALLVAADDDDPSAPAYAQLGARILSEPRGLGPIINVLALEAAAAVPAVGFLGDDHRPRTVHWDRRLLAALDGRPGVVYGNDLYQGEWLPTAVVISSPVILALGYMVPPGVEHLFMDDFWKRLGEDLGCLKYLPDVIIEHEHPVVGKAAWDEGYEQANSPRQWARDQGAYHQFLAGRWPADLARLQAQLAAAR